jgi:hypothetical protein
MNQNRKDRRNYAKAFGFFEKKKSMNTKQYLEHLHKSILAGKQIQRDFDDFVENQKVSQAAENDSNAIAGLVETGLSYEEAKNVIETNSELRRKRNEKLARKKR